MREAVESALRRYLRYIKPSGSHNLGGPCPFHKGGMESKPSFYMNTNNGLYYCHTCHAKGTLSQFLKRMGAPAAEVELHIEIARKSPKRKRRLTKDPGLGDHFLPEGILGIFDYCPRDLVNEGFDKKVLKRMEVGFDTEEMRITFPLRDLYGNLCGISGRTVINEYPRYKVYKSDDFIRLSLDEREGRDKYGNYDIKNHNFLWNAHNVYPGAFFGETDCVIIVEGYKACLWLLQNGIENVIAMQGSRMTWIQERILSRLGVTYILLLDADKAGREGTFDTAQRLRRVGRNVLCCNYPDWLDDDAQPDGLTEEELFGVLDAAQPFPRWRQQPCNINLKRTDQEWRRTSGRGSEATRAS